MKLNQWTKSTRSGPWTDNCVEVMWTGTVVLVRDSKDFSQPPLVFTPAEWNAFIGGAGDGEFDL